MFRSQPIIASVPEIIEEARNGRMVILVDDEDRENEGDLILPAQLCTPETIAFMAVNGRGLVCLALTGERVNALGLSPMVRHNGTRHGTAFTVSIEAREGIDTGISASDRARTIAAAINSANGPDAIVTPGHMFPLIARDGGVLVRAGHTEAAVDIARLAGLNPSGVICEVVNDDGTMARLDDLIAFGERHKLKIGTIRDLIAHRLRHDNLVEQTGERVFDSRWGGRWKAIAFRNRLDGGEILALMKGTLDPDATTLVRMHALDPLADILAEEVERGSLLRRAMELIAVAGNGVVVLLSDPCLTVANALRRDSTGSPIVELRDYGIGAQVLSAIGVHQMMLLTNNHQTPVALSGYGLTITGEQPF